MTVLPFIAAIAWPVVVLVIAFVYRPQIIELFQRFESGEVAGVKVSLIKRELALVEQKFLAARASSPEQWNAPAPAESDVGLKTRAAKLAAESPAAAILYSWTELEGKLVAYAKRHVGSDVSPRMSVRSLLKVLLEHRLIDQINFDILMNLRGIRNKAAHPEGDAVAPTVEEAKKFARYVAGISRALDLDLMRGIYGQKTDAGAPAA